MAKIVLALGNDISTDDIYPGRHMATVLPTETPQFCFANRTDFNTQANAGAFPPGSIILGAENFGCGSSREQAVSTLKGHGFVLVVRSISRIFLQNAINLGLPVWICPGVEGEEGHELSLEGGKVQNLSTGQAWPLDPLPPARQGILDAGGLIPYTRQRLLAESKN